MEQKLSLTILTYLLFLLFLLFYYINHLQPAKRKTMNTWNMPEIFVLNYKPQKYQKISPKSYMANEFQMLV